MFDFFKRKLKVGDRVKTTVKGEKMDGTITAISVDPEPIFHFGDKVMICKKKGVFAFYEGDGGRFIVEGFNDLLFTKFKDVKSGWDNV